MRSKACLTRPKKRKNMKYEVKRDCKKAALHLRMPESYVYLFRCKTLFAALHLRELFLVWVCCFSSCQCCKSFLGKYIENCEEILWLNSAGLWRNSTGSGQEMISIWEENMERNWWLCTKVKPILSSMSSICVPCMHCICILSLFSALCRALRSSLCWKV